MAPPSVAPIGGIYAIDFNQPLADAAPGVVFGATSAGRPGKMAVQLARETPARAWTLATLSGSPIRNLLVPLAHGPAVTPSGIAGYFVICDAPPGPSVAATLRPWTEAELLEDLVKPIAAVLAELQSRGITHRAICPTNVFQAAPHRQVILGTAWTAPPAAHQPVWCEPPYSGVCQPWARGEGTMADDVYALGVLLLTLCLGRNPLEGMPDEDVLRRKLDMGSFAALTATHRLPIGIAELLRGMLADDPDHRPSAALLTNPLAARARRIAIGPVRRVPRGIEIAGCMAQTARALAHAIARAPVQAVTALRTGIIDRWLRHGLEDASLAGRVDSVVRQREIAGKQGGNRADAILVTQVVAVLDPLAPLVWRDLTLWPDATGTVLHQMLRNTPAKIDLLLELSSGTVLDQWQQRRGRTAITIERDNALSRSRDTAWQWSYRLNPLIPCASPSLADFWVVRVTELLPAIEAATGKRGETGGLPLDAHIADFLSARGDDRTPFSVNASSTATPADVALAQLAVLSRLQEKLYANPLPNLAAWAASALQPMIQDYRSRSRRTRTAARLAELAAAGQLAPIAALFTESSELGADHAGLLATQYRLANLARMLTAFEASGPAQTAQSRRSAQEVVAGLGALACLAGLAYAVLS